KRTISSGRLLRPAAEIVDQAELAARLAREASVAAMQDQPVTRMQHELRRDDLLEPKLDLERRLARRKTGAIADAEDMRIDRHRMLAIGHVEHAVRRLAAGARQRLNLGAGARHLAAELGQQLLRERDHILRLHAEQADGLDVVA